MTKRPARQRPSRVGKTTAKSTAVEKIPQPHGGALNSGGTPGNAGGGRPEKAFKQFLAELRKNPDVQDELEAAAKDRTCTGYRAALSLMERYDEERPAERKVIQLEGDEDVAKAWRIIRERIHARLESAVAEDLIKDIHRAMQREGI